jgi:hypothetical protein
MTTLKKYVITYKNTDCIYNLKELGLWSFGRGFELETYDKPFDLSELNDHYNGYIPVYSTDVENMQIAYECNDTYMVDINLFEFREIEYKLI